MNVRPTAAATTRRYRIHFMRNTLPQLNRQRFPPVAGRPKGDLDPLSNCIPGVDCSSTLIQPLGLVRFPEAKGITTGVAKFERGVVDILNKSPHFAAVFFPRSMCTRFLRP